jgi:putative endonuclease
MTNKPLGTLYIGVTTNLLTRVEQHIAGDTEGFTKRYGLKRLVWVEEHPSIESAILREKQLKKWRRAWKIRLIESMNLEWNDLSKNRY